MSEQKISQSKELIKCPKNIWIIVITIGITALIVGGAVYVWQRANLKSTEQSLQKQIAYLQNQIGQLQQLQNNQRQGAEQSTVDQNNLSDSYSLDCMNNNNEADFQSKYSWYKHLKEQNVGGWWFNEVCYNKELNKAVYLKIDIKNGFTQLGFYDIAKDKFNEGTTRKLGLYEGCADIKQWLKNNAIIYQCVSGDEGDDITQTYYFNIDTGTVELIQTCDSTAAGNL